MVNYINKVLITLGLIIGAILLGLIIYFVLPHFLPFILAYFITLMLEPINSWIISRSKLKRGIAVNITFFLFLGFFSLLIYFIVTRISTQTVDLIKFIQKNIPAIQDWFVALFQQFQNYNQLLPHEIAFQINNEFFNFINQLASMDLLSKIGELTIKFTTAIPNFFIVLILVIISVYLFSLNLHQIKRQFYEYFSVQSKDKLTLVLKDLRLATIGFVQAQFILSTITYFVSLIGLVILGVKYSLAIAFFIVIVDILPILGTGSVLVPWGIFSITRGQTFTGIGLIVLFIVITVLRRIIEPKILGERIGLKPLPTLISLWVGFKVLGIIGIFLGPFILILYKSLVKANVIRYKIKI